MVDQLSLIACEQPDPTELTAMNAYAPAKADDKLLTKKQAANRLAISVRTLDRMVARRILTKVFIGGAPRFRKSDIDAVVAHGV